MPDTHFMTFTIAVSLDLGKSTPHLTILDNPHIPRNTVATIVWVASANSEPFEFTGFRWCKESKALTTPIRLGPGMAAMVSNRDLSEIGEWPYQVGVTPLSRPDEVIWSNQCKDAPIEPVTGIRQVVAFVSSRINGLWMRKDSKPDTASATPAGPVAEAGTLADAGQSSPELPKVEAMIVSGPMIVTTRV